MFVYWLIGNLFDDIESLTLGVGVIRSVEYISSAVSFCLGAAKSVSPMANLVVAFAMFVFAVPATTWAVFLVLERLEIAKLEDWSSSGDEAGEESENVSRAELSVDGMK